MKEDVWLQIFLGKTKVASFIVGPVLLYYDSTGTLAENPCLHHAYSVTFSSCNEVTLILGRSMQRRNLADPLTKPLGIKEFDNHQRKMGI